ncbi:hypothetical protein [Pseudomonas syringae]|nr:hypothetical protein [Pseudomonas syringae]MCF5371972.1 hypothetical protein [Pseudomonas syringae]MCF5382031.1 hypothetical protein [Pseudomonas syringae]MCF5419436.1 hypothetical protein [Pseudomonas syringae]MCF5451982.1 hypothetical protein [Pseudomonas syringae]
MTKANYPALAFIVFASAFCGNQASTALTKALELRNRENSMAADAYFRFDDGGSEKNRVLLLTGVLDAQMQSATDVVDTSHPPAVVTLIESYTKTVQIMNFFRAKTLCSKWEGHVAFGKDQLDIEPSTTDPTPELCAKVMQLPELG